MCIINFYLLTYYFLTYLNILYNAHHVLYKLFLTKLAIATISEAVIILPQ